MPSSACQTCARSEEHTSELQSLTNLVCRLLLEKKKPVSFDSPRQRTPKSSVSEGTSVKSNLTESFLPNIGSRSGGMHGSAFSIINVSSKIPLVPGSNDKTISLNSFGWISIV